MRKVKIFTVSFVHSSGLFHKSVAVLSGYENPNAHRIIAVVDCFSFIINRAQVWRNFGRNANHLIPTQWWPVAWN